MATEKELRELRADVRRWQHSSNKLLKQYIDYREAMGYLPKPLRRSARIVRGFGRAQRARARKLTSRIQRKRRGPEAAISYLRSVLGTVESPPSSNDGTLVRRWWSWLGYTFPVPWCGCLAGYGAIRKGGAAIPAKLRLGYTPYIVDDALAGRNGLRSVSAAECRKGDLVVFHFGSGGAKHVGVAEGPAASGQVTTIDGNTSGPGGSQADGGGVFRRTRPVSQVICFARPAY